MSFSPSFPACPTQPPNSNVIPSESPLTFASASSPPDAISCYAVLCKSNRPSICRCAFSRMLLFPSTLLRFAPHDLLKQRRPLLCRRPKLLNLLPRCNLQLHLCNL
jgi:hypothetical protein